MSSPLPPPHGFQRDASARTESYYATSPHTHLTPSLLADLRQRAQHSRENVRLCLHTAPSDTLHEMLIFQWADHFFPPKKHPHKTKSFRIIEGSLALLQFHPDGALSSTQTLSAADSLQLRIGPDTYHADIPLTPFTIHLETTTGPFHRDTDRILAPWAPPPGDAPALARWRAHILQPVIRT